jgi:tRNA A37 threonylcarbamoyladenosine modification protein TsaB
MRKFLGFNSIFGNLEAIIFSEKSIIDYCFLSNSIQMSEALGDFLQNFLKKNQMKYQDFDFLFFFNGPSSFMKIRNGISHSFGIKFALGDKIQLLNLNLFEVYEFIIKKDFYDHLTFFSEKNQIIILKGFGNSFFVQSFQHNSQKKIWQMVKFSDFLNFLGEIDFINQNIKIFFNSIEILEKILSEFNVNYQNIDSNIYENLKNFFLNNHFIFDSSKSLIRFASEMIMEKIQSNQKLEKSFFEIKPFYLLNPEFRKISDKKFEL